MAEEKTLKKPKQDSTFTKLSVNFYGQGKFEGMTLEEVLGKYPKGTKVIINGEEVILKGK